MYELLISSRADREIKKLPYEIQNRILEALMEIKEDPYFGKPLTQEHQGKLSCKVGAHRIVYKILEKDKKVFVFTAGHRSTVYQ